MKRLLLLALLSYGIKVNGQVNLQTGSSVFSLPVFNWQDDKSRLNAGVSVGYNSGNGVKVSDLPSNIGQGWSLVAGGVINRIQVGEPDDQKPREGNVDDVTKYPAGFLYDASDPKAGCPGALLKYPIFEEKNKVYKQHNSIAADRELDKFAYQINGRSGIFVLQKNNGDHGLVLEDANLRIWFTRDESMDISQGIRTTINVFYIQDENGLVYKFAQKELAKVMRTDYCDANFVSRHTQPNFKSGTTYHEGAFDNTGIVNPYIVSAWYLTEVEDVLTHRKINYTYTNRLINTKAGVSLALYGEKNYTIITHNHSLTITPRISSIALPDGNGVAFNYGKERVDLKGDYALASIENTYDGRTVSRHEFATSYFIQNRYGDPVSDFQKRCARLCLMSIKKIGVDLKGEDPPYLFDYNLGSNAADDFVPPPFVHLKDIWGFYNGNNNADFGGTPIPINKELNELSNDQIKGLCYVRSAAPGVTLNPKAGYAKNGLLKEIIYPSGGKLQYTYAQNAAIVGGQLKNVGGVHVSQAISTDGGYSNDCTNPLVTNYNYVAPNGTDPSLWGVETPVNNFTSMSHYEPEDKYYHWGIRGGCFPFGCCKYKYRFPGILAREQAISLTGRQQTMETLSLILDVVSAVMVVVDVINVISVGLASSGYGAIIALIIDIVANLVTIGTSCLGDFSKDTYTTVYYNYDLNASNPLPSQFSRVEVVEGVGTNGKTVMEFTDPSDYAIWSPTNEASSSKQRYAHWAYGLPKKTTVYDGSSIPVKQTENQYYIFKRQELHPGTGTYWMENWSCKCLPVKTSSQRNTNWENPFIYNYPNTGNYSASNPDIKVDIYNAFSGGSYLDRQYERIFKPGSATEYLETSTKYYHDNAMVFNTPSANFKVSRIETYNSNGDNVQKDFLYNNAFGKFVGPNQPDVVNPPGNTDPGILMTLLTNNINVPVSVSTSINGKLAEETVTEYKQLANGNIVPYKSMEQRFNQPTAVPPGVGYKGPLSTSNPSYTVTQERIFSNTGNVIGAKDEGNRMITSIYDYNDKFIVASVTNADPIADKPAYSSFETSTLGGWSLTGAATYNSSLSVTGTRSFILSSGKSFSAPLNTAKGYIVSFWSNNAGVSVTGGTLKKSAPTVNGFTYYEYVIATGNSTVGISSSNSTIDELRLYPQTARMKTSAYDPLIGKIAECGENNRITYLEYDDKSRLRFIKDEEKNTLKMYEYNISNKKPAGACAVTYSNLSISEEFIRNNCPEGYTGSKVVYTIPASKYTSDISQEYVDMLAQKELDELGQAYANTNGTCTRVYYNTARSQYFTKEGCPVGYIGTQVLYTVPANKYSSTVDQAAADLLAQEEMDANGQANANMPGVGDCVIDYEADWVGTGTTRCELGPNGSYTGNEEMQVIDRNPNSPTYNTYNWAANGPSVNCTPICAQCTAVNQKCINGVCEWGMMVATYSTESECHYHYEFSDGSWSPTYVDYGGACY